MNTFIKYIFKNISVEISENTRELFDAKIKAFTRLVSEYEKWYSKNRQFTITRFFMRTLFLSTLIFSSISFTGFGMFAQSAIAQSNDNSTLEPVHMAIARCTVDSEPYRTITVYVKSGDAELAKESYFLTQNEGDQGLKEYQAVISDLDAIYDHEKTVEINFEKLFEEEPSDGIGGISWPSLDNRFVKSITAVLEFRGTFKWKLEIDAVEGTGVLSHPVIDVDTGPYTEEDSVQCTVPGPVSLFL